jgi:hypothetical protein
MRLRDVTPPRTLAGLHVSRIRLIARGEGLVGILGLDRMLLLE